MANFNIPFSRDGGRRVPTSDERLNGFPCGPADQSLFNGLFYAIQAELGHLILYAGLTGTDANHTQVRQAVEALIEAATGGGDPSTYLLMAQARARLPIFPEVQNLSGTGKLNVTSPSTGVVRVPNGITILHRGIFPVVTATEDFPTTLSRTYHLRWNPTDGFQLKDLTDVAYNPSILAETDPSFDSTYDDMLVSRVVTNSSNIATITNLANRHRLYSESVFNLYTPFSGTGWQALNLSAVTLDWARTPLFKNLALQGVRGNATDWTDSNNTGGDMNKQAVRNTTVTRYVAANLEYVYNDSQGTDGRAIVERTFLNV